MLTALPQNSLHHSPRSRNDGIISPFLLDPTTITSSKRYSTNLYKAIWLHMPVIIRDLQTPHHAIRQVQYLSNLRHPNLEQFLGAVIDAKHNAIITEFINGTLLTHLLTEKLHPSTALSIAIDVSRALLYLHATTGTPHGALSDRSVIYDHVRKRAVVLLSNSVGTTFPCAAPECCDPSAADTPADVYSLAVLLLLLFSADKYHLSMHDVYNLPKRLQYLVVKALCRDALARPTVEQLCQALVDAQPDL